ncbi:MAG: hypothetical protein AAF361_14895 [Bacteroidota bacterium]
MATGTRTFFLLLLASLMVCKASAFHFCDHEHEHEEDIDHCELCDLAIEIQQADAIPAVENVENVRELPPEPLRNPQLRSLEAPNKVNLSYRLYGRPPPER